MCGKVMTNKKRSKAQRCTHNISEKYQGTTTVWAAANVIVVAVYTQRNTYAHMQQQPTRLEKHARQTGCGSTWLHYSIFIMRHVWFINNSYVVWASAASECVRMCVRAMCACECDTLRLSVCLWHFRVYRCRRRTVYIPIPCEDNDCSVFECFIFFTVAAAATVVYGKVSTACDTHIDRAQTLHVDCVNAQCSTLYWNAAKKTIHSPRKQQRR